MLKYFPVPGWFRCSWATSFVSMIGTPGASVDDVSSRIRGPVGTPVELTLRAPDGELSGHDRPERVDLRPTTTFERFDHDPAYPRPDTPFPNRYAAMT